MNNKGVTGPFEGVIPKIKSKQSTKTLLGIITFEIVRKTGGNCETLNFEDQDTKRLCEIISAYC